VSHLPPKAKGQQPPTFKPTSATPATEHEEAQKQIQSEIEEKDYPKLDVRQYLSKNKNKPSPGPPAS
jgi:hypothetical protein